MSPPQQPALAPLHVYAIDALAQETKRPLAEVAHVYVDELTRLQTGARVQDYLVLLTSKRVRESLRRGKPPRFLEPSAFSPLPEEELR
jgi:hypothetical protein